LAVGAVSEGLAFSADVIVQLEVIGEGTVEAFAPGDGIRPRLGE
jgi:hypothetical protein